MVFSIYIFSFRGLRPRPHQGSAPESRWGTSVPSPPVLSPSETNFWLRPCIPIFIGWTFLNVANTSSVWLMYRCQHNQAPRYLIDHCTPVSHGSYRQRRYVPPAVMRSLYHDTGSVPTNVGCSLLLAELSGTLCLRT